jgi:ribonucleotide reductase beta subunit family protein with ferritin-like domain
MENIHSETYALLIDTYIKDPKSAHSCSMQSTRYLASKLRATGRRSGLDKQSTFGERCIAFACVEGIFFSGAFCSIFWMKERGLLPDYVFERAHQP